MPTFVPDLPPEIEMYLIGINGGHIRSTVVVHNTKEKKHEFVEYGPSLNIHATGLQKLIKIAGSILHATALRLGLSGILELAKRTDGITLSLPGAFRGNAADDAKTLLDEAFQSFKTRRVVDDTFSGLYAAVAQRSGTCIFCGAGASIGISNGDLVVKLDGRGPVAGDCGSGFHLVSLFLQRLGRRIDRGGSLDLRVESFIAGTFDTLETDESRQQACIEFRALLMRLFSVELSDNRVRDADELKAWLVAELPHLFSQFPDRISALLNTIRRDCTALPSDHPFFTYRPPEGTSFALLNAVSEYCNLPKADYSLNAPTPDEDMQTWFDDLLLEFPSEWRQFYTALAKPLLEATDEEQLLESAPLIEECSKSLAETFEIAKSYLNKLGLETAPIVLQGSLLVKSERYRRAFIAAAQLKEDGFVVSELKPAVGAMLLAAEATQGQEFATALHREYVANKLRWRGVDSSGSN